MGRKHIALVQYASPDLVPANLRVMAAVNYSGGTPPDQLRQISSHWYNPGDTIPARYEQIGAVTYNWGDTIPSNLPILAAMEPDPSFWDAELLLNGGFETAGAGGADVLASWTEVADNGTITVTSTAGEVYGGAKALKLTSGGQNTRVTQSVAVMPGRNYCLSFYTRGDGTRGGRYTIYDDTNSAFIANGVATGVTAETYQKVNIYFRAPDDCVSVQLQMLCPTANGGVAYFDDVSLKGAA